MIDLWGLGERIWLTACSSHCPPHCSFLLQFECQLTPVFRTHVCPCHDTQGSQAHARDSSTPTRLSPAEVGLHMRPGSATSGGAGPADAEGVQHQQHQGQPRQRSFAGISANSISLMPRSAATSFSGAKVAPLHTPGSEQSLLSGASAAAMLTMWDGRQLSGLPATSQDGTGSNGARGATLATSAAAVPGAGSTSLLEVSIPCALEGAITCPGQESKNVKGAVTFMGA